MLPEILQARAADYVAGAMTAEERDAFEVVLEYHRELRRVVVQLQRVSAAATLAEAPVGAEPPASLRARLLHSLAHLPPPVEEGLVVTDGDGRIEWVNPAFTAMCGYSLDELRGRKPGHVLQGPATDQATVGRLRAAVRDRRPCREQVTNYHKNGSTYRADIRMAPVLDDAGEPLWFVARERQIHHATTAAR